MCLEKKIWQGPHSLTFKTHRTLSFQGKEQSSSESSSTLNSPVTRIPQRYQHRTFIWQSRFEILNLFSVCFQHAQKHLWNNKRVLWLFFFLLYFWLWYGFKFHGSPSDFIRLRTAGWKIQHCSFNKQLLKKQKENQVLSDVQTKTKTKQTNKASDKCYNFKTGLKTKDHDYFCKEIGRHRG